MLKNVDVGIAYRLLATGAVIMVSSSYDGKKGVMTCAWNMPLDYHPSKIALVMAKGSYTRSLLEKSGEFIINVPGPSMMEKLIKAGSCHGNEVDKFKQFGIEELKADKVSAPLIKGCIGYLECKLINEPEMAEKYDLLLGEVVAAHAEEKAFANEHLLCNDPSFSVLHHVEGGTFILDGEIIKA